MSPVYLTVDVFPDLAEAEAELKAAREDWKTARYVLTVAEVCDAVTEELAAAHYRAACRYSTAVQVHAAIANGKGG